MQILVLGMHRSGTSATARLINMMGAYFSPSHIALKASHENPKGFWERRDVIAVNKELMALECCDWNHLPHWNFTKKSNPPASLIEKMQLILQDLDKNNHWFIKEPRMCLTLSYWLPLLNNPIALIVYRDPHEIAVSLKTRNQMSYDYSIALWEYYAVSLLNQSQHLPRIFVSHAALLSRPMDTCEYLFNELSLKGAKHLTMPHRDAVEEFIDPKLYRSKPINSEMQPLSDEQKYLCDLLQGAATQSGSLHITDQSKQIIKSGLK